MAFDRNITVVKIGGNVIDNEAALNRFVEDFAQLPSPKTMQQSYTTTTAVSLSLMRT